MVVKVIIDCDPGMDDAMALFMLLESHFNQEIEIVAVTVANGNSTLENCLENVGKILQTSKATDVWNKWNISF